MGPGRAGVGPSQMKDIKLVLSCLAWLKDTFFVWVGEEKGCVLLAEKVFLGVWPRGIGLEWDEIYKSSVVLSWLFK